MPLPLLFSIVFSLAHSHWNLASAFSQACIMVCCLKWTLEWTLWSEVTPRGLPQNNTCSVQAISIRAAAAIRCWSSMLEILSLSTADTSAKLRMTHSYLMTAFQRNTLFASAVSGNMGWERNYTITPPQTSGARTDINKYIHCKLCMLMPLIACQMKSSLKGVKQLS